MSLFGSMKTSVSGMNAQANRLSTVADNIANANTTGYKRASTSFSSLVLPSASGNYNSGGVQTSIRRAISEQGDINFTTSDTDLSISGAGFFVVQDASGVPVLTRAGDFTKDAFGNLVNSAGYALMGYTFDGGAPAVVVNGFSGLVPINLNESSLSVHPSTSGVFKVNLPANAAEAANDMMHAPSDNKLPASYDRKFTVSSSDVTEDFYADVYMTKIGDNKWEVTAFGRHGAVSSGLPYDVSDPAPMATTTLTFDPATGAIVGGNPMLTISALDDPFTIDLSGMTQATGPSANNMGAHTNLPSDAPEIDTAGGELPPSSNEPSSVYVAKQTWTGFVDFGPPTSLDVYYAKTGPNTWEVSYYSSAASTAGGFPYSTPALTTQTLTFDPSTGALLGPASLTVPISTGNSFDVDLTGMTSLPSNDPTVANQSGGLSLSYDLSSSTSIFKPFLIGQTPAQNQADSVYTNKSSLIAYDKLGAPVHLDIYYAKGPDGAWEMTVFNHADASNGGFPYGAPGSPPLATTLH
ncbi:flagellar hook FlgE-like protein [Rhizobium sp. NXC14]|nr:flagellar hook FlgE-like protein [Rhizobium sp. NXC14]